MMVRDAGRIAAELVPVACVVASLALALGLIRVALKRPVDEVVAPKARAVAKLVEPAREVAPLAVVEAVDRVIEPDLVAGEVMALEAWADEEGARAEALMTQARTISGTVEATEAELAKLKGGAERTELSLNELGRRIVELEKSAVALDVERAAIQRRRDAKRAELAAARAKGSEAYAVLPMAGPRGTWRQPIVIDCLADRIQILPDGPTFGLLDLGLGMGPRGNPVVAAVRRKAVEAQATASPDGRPSVPYLMFLVRPDGIRAYYEARSALESLGIAFGYELVDADWEIEAPPSRETQPATLAGNGEPARWPRSGMGGGGNPLTEELPVWTTPEPASRAAGASGLPSGEDAEGGQGGNWRIGFAEALDEKMAGERPGGASREGSRAVEIGAGDGIVAWPAGREVPTGLADMRRMGETPSGLRVGFAAPRSADGMLGEGGRRDIGAAGNGPSGAGGFTGEGSSEHGEGGVGGGLAAGAGPSYGGRGGTEAEEPGVNGGGTVGDGGRGMAGVLSLGAAPGGSAGGDAGSSGGGGGGGDARAARGGIPGMTSVGSTAGGEATAGFGLGGVGSGPGGWYDIRLVCDRTGITINPGGYRLSREATEAGGLLLPRVRYLARRGSKAEDGTPLQPRLRFVVQPGGEGMFWLARQQTTFAGLEWPATLQVGEPGQMGGLVGASGVLDQ